jgi:serine/threonine protein kinase
MCIVYKALDASLKRAVALKVLRPSLADDPSVAKRFHRESVLAANLAHPNIVPVFSHSHHPPSPPYFTMELVEGHTIKDEVERLGRLDPREATRIVLDVASGLHFAHERGVIHRDVTPRNILLQGPEHHVRIADFGIARELSGTLADVTQTEGLTFGTPAFTSPEQNLGQPVDRRTDVYSLGTTLYYMLTGKTPYTAVNRAQLAMAFQGPPPPPPSTFNAGIGAELDRIVMKMIAVRPGERYPTCRHVVQAMRAYLAQDARPRRRDGEQRHLTKALILAGAACIVGLAAWLTAGRGCDSPTRSLVSPKGDSRNPYPALPVAGDADQNGLAASSPTDMRAGAPEAGTAAAGSRPSNTLKTNAGAARASVKWVYQPDPNKDFAAPNALKGHTTLNGSHSEHAGMYVFDPDKGLSPYTGTELNTVDFRIASANNVPLLQRDAPDDRAGGIFRSSADAFGQDSAPTSGYSSYYSHELQPGVVIFFRCVRGGHAKMQVLSAMKDEG